MDGEHTKVLPNDDEYEISLGDTSFSFDINDVYADSSESGSSYNDNSTLDNMESKVERSDDGERPKQTNAGGGMSRLKPSHYGKEYAETTSKQMITMWLPIVRKLVHAIMTQMSCKQGFKKYGKRAMASMFNELRQLHVGAMEGKPVVEPVAWEDTTEEQRREALEAVELIQLNRLGTLKSRICANEKNRDSF